MKQYYLSSLRRLTALVGWLGLLLGAVAVQAQSGPYGNEWINTNQQYAKIKVAKDGIYRLNYAYLQQAGVPATLSPARLQLFRRGKEVAIYIGGNSNALDNTTFVEFYGQRNDGALDKEMYKNPAEQSHQLYSLYTDTAAYFLTWSATATGKRMAMPSVSAPGNAQPFNLTTRTVVQFKDGVNTGYGGPAHPAECFLPWMEKSEGFVSENFGWGVNSSNTGYEKYRGANYYFSDTLVNRATGGPNPTVELLMQGLWYHAQHNFKVWAVQPGGTERLLGQEQISMFDWKLLRYKLQPSDIPANNVATLRVEVLEPPTLTYASMLVAGFLRITYAQPQNWSAGAANVVKNDSTLTSIPTVFTFSGAPAQTLGYDVTNPYNVSRFVGQAVGGSQQLAFSNTALPTTHTYHVADASKTLVPAAPIKIRFRSITPAAHNFMIISSHVLMKPAGGVQNPVRAYADYRASTLGGRHDTLVVTSQQLYDQFHYGEKSGIAVRHFVLWMLNNTPATARQKYLLLLGKGLGPVEKVGYSTGGSGHYRKNPSASTTPDLVPTSTHAYSDNFFSADWPNGNYEPRVPTGRVPAKTPEQVMNYLNKLKEHESLTDEPWRKNALNLSGGDNASEQSEFLGYVNEYKSLYEKPCQAGKVIRTISRTVPSGLPITVDIGRELSNGLSLITYFGHGSSVTLNPDMGNLANYSHKGKYPVVVIAGGCISGNTYNSGISIAENWILTADKGAIGYWGDSDYGLANHQHDFTKQFYTALFNDPNWYGKPLMEVKTEAIRRVIRIYGINDRFLTSMVMNTTWQGDPALKLYSPDKPDLVVKSQDLRLNPTQVLAADPTFQLKVPIKQTGKACYGDSVYVKVTRTYPSGSTAPQEVQKVGFAAVVDSTVFTFNFTNPTDPNKVFGLNTFRVDVDPDNKIIEQSENNNQATLTYNFLKQGVTLLSPTNYAIVGRANVALVVQSSTPQASARVYEFEIDTVASFTSSVRRPASPISATDVAKWQPNLPTTGRDSVVYYWRARLQGDADWVSSSFRLINNSPGGWSQSHYDQLASATTTGVAQQKPSGKWTFPNLSRSLTLRTRGGGNGMGTFQPQDGIFVDNQVPAVLCGQGTFNAFIAVFNDQTLEQVDNIPGGPYLKCGSMDPYYFFGIKYPDDLSYNPARQAELISFLQNVPIGYYIALISVNGLSPNRWPIALKTEFLALGSQKFSQIQEYDPYVMVARKGYPTQIQEVTFDPTSIIPRNEQVVELQTTIRARPKSGTIVSTRIGPVQQWQNLYHTVKTPEPQDSYKLQLIGYDTNNQRVVLNPNVTSRSYSLSGVSAAQYPYLQLELQVTDSVNFTPPQLKQWLVTYKGLPEGVVRRDKAPAAAYTKATLDDAAKTTGILTIPVYFENVSLDDFPAQLKAQATVQMADGSNSKAVELTSARALKADSTVVFNFSMDVRKFKGDGIVRLVVNPNILPELHYFNNEMSVSFTAPAVNVPPVLDVAFDGTHILNGDIVAPAPEIRVDVKYQDLRQPLDDPNKIELYLTRPGSTSPEKISMTGNGNVNFQLDNSAGRATVVFKPGTLADGKYKLEAQATDMNGNQAAAQRYAVDFEVVNTSSISNIYPYPNPVTSKTRFVFTLTGSEVPRNMKIQIMTLTGKVVREIMQSELGPLRIGNNVTDFAWDGTDAFGDRLANGTYLYRVVLDDPTGKFEHRRTSGDWAFKNNWGKVVLLR